METGAQSTQAGKRGHSAHPIPFRAIALDARPGCGLASIQVETEKRNNPLITPARLVVVVLLLALLVGAAFLLFEFRVEIAGWARRATALIREQGPVPFFAALAVLPAVGLPVSAFYLAAGAAFPLAVSVTGTAVGLAINITLTYWMARKWFRGGIQRLLSRTRYRIPAVAATDHVRLTLFLRLMPGPPFFLQSYLLGLIEVPFATYFLISWGTQVLIATGFIVLGSAFYSSSMGRALIAVVIVILLTIVVQWVRRYLARRAVPAPTVADPAGIAGPARKDGSNR